MRVLMLALIFGVLARAALSAVEPAVVGTWVQTEASGARLEWEIRADGSYAMRRDGQLLHEGRANFADGAWSIRSPLVGDAGAFWFQDENLVIAGSRGPGLWSRPTVIDNGGTPVPGEDVVPDPTGLHAYLEGLEALRGGDFELAVGQFTGALQKRGDDPGFVLARGAAAVLAGRFEDAAADLQRYSRLGGQGREGTLWLYALETMTGTVIDPSHGAAPLRSQQAQGAQATFMGVPGHVIQGGNDYPTAFASFLIHDMAQPYAEARESGRLADAAGVRAAMAEIGRWFAHRNIATAELAPFNLTKAWRHLDAGNPPEALTYAGFALIAEPANDEAMQIEGQARLALGQAATARRLFTAALTQRANDDERYLGRARAAARLGDGKRVGADLAAAAALDPGADAFRPEIAAALAARSESRAPVELMAALSQAAADGRPMAELEALARGLRLAVAAQRLRYDELYQERLYTLEAAVEAAPGDPDARVALARYLMEEASLRSETVEPRRGPVPWRWQDSEVAELGRALSATDDALALDPDHVRAMLQKAAVLSRLDDEAEAERWADRALGAAPSDPEALGLYAYYKARRANRLIRAAAALRSDSCSSSSWTENRSDGVYRVTRTTCTPPSQADVNRARQYDAEAAALRKRSRAAMEKAIEATRGTYLGYLIQADAALWSGQPAAAAEALQAAIALNPDDLRAHDALVDVHEQLGDPAAADAQRAARNGLIQTTAAPMLARAWDQITRQQWQAAGESLARARVLDPEDARAPAYKAVLEAATGDPAAVHGVRLALALERSRLALDGGMDGSADGLRDIADAGLLLALTDWLARERQAAGDLEGALALLDSAAAVAAVSAPGWRARQMVTAVLPDPALPLDRQPESPNGATLVAGLHLEAGRLLKALGRGDEALARFQAAVDLGPPIGRPRIATGSGDSNFAADAGVTAGDALIELALLLMERREYEAAQRALEGMGYMKLSDDMRVKANEMSMALSKIAASGYGAPPLDPQQQQQLQQAWLAYEQMINSTTLPDWLVGTWTLEGRMAYVPGSGALEINAHGGFRLVDAEGREGYGRLGLIQGVRLIMLRDDGTIDELFLEPLGPDHYLATRMDGVTFDLRRRS